MRLIESKLVKKFNNLRILFPLDVCYPSRLGGYGNSVHWLNKSLNKVGVKTTIISTTRGMKETVPLNKKTMKYGVETYYFNYFLSPLFCFSLFYWMWKNIRNYDLVHFNSFFSRITILGIFIARMRKVKYILSPRGELFPSSMKFNYFRKLLYLLFFNILFKNSTYHLTKKEEKLPSAKKSRVYVIPNIVENIVLTSKIPSIDKYILYLGRIHRRKRIHQLISAFKKIKGDIKLYIVGQEDDDYLNELKKLADSRVKFLGYKFGNDKANILRNAEMLVLPSEDENFGNVVVEALSVGTPVIATKTTGWNILKKEGVGVIVDKDLKLLVSSIEKLLGKKRSIKSKAILLAKKYTWKSLIPDYMKMYKDAKNN